MNCNVKLRTNTRLVTIKNILKKRHNHSGMISDLVLWKGEKEDLREGTELHDGDMTTLTELGIKGGTRDNAPSTTLYYYLKKSDHVQVDPILLA